MWLHSVASLHFPRLQQPGTRHATIHDKLQTWVTNQLDSLGIFTCLLQDSVNISWDWPRNNCYFSASSGNISRLFENPCLIKSMQTLIVETLRQDQFQVRTESIDQITDTFITWTKRNIKTGPSVVLANSLARTDPASPWKDAATVKSIAPNPAMKSTVVSCVLVTFPPHPGNSRQIHSLHLQTTFSVH